MNENKKSLSDQAHEAMHQIPGVPEHGEAERLNNRGGLQNRPLQNRSLESKPLQGARINHPHREPKILVNWQKRIARFFGADMK
jgi:hypothetical protein